MISPQKPRSVFDRDDTATVLLNASRFLFAISCEKFFPHRKHPTHHIFVSHPADPTPVAPRTTKINKHEKPRKPIFQKTSIVARRSKFVIIQQFFIKRRAAFGAAGLSQTSQVIAAGAADGDPIVD